MGKRVGPRRHIVVAILLSLATVPGCGPSPERIELPAVAGLGLDVVVVPESQPWLAAVACPLLRRLAPEGPLPLVLCAAAEPDSATVGLLRRFPVERVHLLGNDASDGPPVRLPFAPHRLATGREPLAASLGLAQLYWQRPVEVFAADATDPLALSLAALLAGHAGAPMLAFRPEADGDALAIAVSRLGSAELTIVGSETTYASMGTRLPDTEIRTWSCERAEREWNDRLQPGGPPTIVLARRPDARSAVGATSWLAPYVSLARRGMPVVVESAKPAVVEEVIGATVRRLSLRSRTLTIVADYRSIGLRTVRLGDDDRDESRYQVNVEPCLGDFGDRLVELGVGRLPVAGLEGASLMFAAGLLREHVLAGAPPTLVMVANPAVDDMQLPFCELVGRMTAAEFKNCGVRAREFYETRANDPAVLAAAATAQVLVYQGHVEHQQLIPKQSEADETDGDVASGPNDHEEMLGHFGALPIVVLQSCDSLRPGVLNRVRSAGGVALLAASTPVHSASGSSLFKAVADASLYRDATLGDALRDAQNYFLCLDQLKRQRGHKERAKGLRAAATFRLWGDPELRLFPQRLPAPARKPVAARMRGAESIAIRVPAQRLGEFRNDGYTARPFPGAHTAGLVVKLKTSSVRKLASLYFFRLPWEGPRPVVKAGAPENDSRTAFRVDPAGRFLYVLNFPEKEVAGEVIALPVARK